MAACGHAFNELAGRDGKAATPFSAPDRGAPDRRRPGCHRPLRCHQDMDYQVGDVRGGISIRFDITPLLLRQQQHAWITGIAALLTMAGLFLLARAFASRMSRRMQRLSKRHEELVQSIDGIVWEADAKTLQFTFVSAQAERLLGFRSPTGNRPTSGWRICTPTTGTWASAYRASCSEQGLPTISNIVSSPPTDTLSGYTTGFGSSPRTASRRYCAA
jgi:hypothetical protein